MLSAKFMLSNVLTCLGLKLFCMFIANIIVSFLIFNPLRNLAYSRNDKLD